MTGVSHRVTPWRNRGVTHRYYGQPAGVPPPIHMRFYKGWHTVHRPSGRGVSRQIVFWGFLATLSPISRSVWGVCVPKWVIW